MLDELLHCKIDGQPLEVEIIKHRNRRARVLSKELEVDGRVALDPHHQPGGT